MSTTTTNNAIADLQSARDRIAAERATVAVADTGDRYDPGAVAAARRMAELDKDLSDADGKFWSRINALADEELLAYRDEQARAVADVTATIPSLRARAESDPSHRPQLNAAYRRVRDDLVPALDRTISARRHARGEQLAREWLRDSGHAVMEQYIIGEAAQLEHVAPLINSHNSAVQAGAAAASMPSLPQGQIARLRELKAYVLALGSGGVHISTSRLPDAVRAYLGAK